MTSSAPTLTARHELPITLIERGRDSLLRVELYAGRQRSAPAAGTVTVVDLQGTEVVSAAAGSVVSAGIQYTIPAATTQDLTLGYGYRVVWTIDGAIYDHDAAVCRRVPYPVVVDQDLWRRAPYLDPSHPAALTREQTLEPYRLDAWLTIQHRLLQSGRRPWLIIDAASLREPHLLLSLALVHEALAIRGGPQLAERAEQYQRRYEAAWGATSMRYDEDDDGDPDSQRSAGGVLWLGSSPRQYLRNRR